jgi:Fe-S oxidoreductase
LAGPAQVVATSVAALVTAVAAVLFVRAVWRMVRVIRLGRPDPERFDGKAARAWTTVVEIVGHTRMLRWTWVGLAHWFVMVAFVLLAALVLEAYVEVARPAGELPLIGGWGAFALVTEVLSVAGIVAIGYLITVRLINRPGRRPESKSRFVGSTMWQGYFVEWVILVVLVLGLSIRGFKAANGDLHWPTWAAPVSHALGGVLPSSGAAVSLIAAGKIVVSMVWVIVISLNLTMGVAWHRFAAVPNIFFKRNRGPALGPLRPMMSDGKPLDFEQADPDKDQFGVAQIEQFTWKGLLDFSTCTECGRCQAQCPAWNTGKPLSPKLVILSLRDHAFANAPYLLGGGDRAGATGAEAERPLVGGAEAGGVIDPDALWACTTCGACVEQCPVDIEHVDHIVDMRRYQVLIESNFPPEAGVMLRNLESKGNPWGAPPNTRDDWTKALDFPVPRASDGADFEYLLWVGCAGAFDDRAKKTSRAVATLLHEAGVSFAILGEGATCTGDPARRLGNEFLFQMMAAQNVEALNAALTAAPDGDARRCIVATCPHCFNTLANEYGQVGGEYRVVHHTQLLADLVATGRLTPVKPVDGSVTYHDPCYLGRHNRVFAPPRQLLGAVAEVTEMPRYAERSFCCGAGGARMWMEERIGRRINSERVDEALATGAGTVAAACPFCLTMLGDGVTSAGADVDVVDVATVLLGAVRPTA